MTPIRPLADVSVYVLLDPDHAGGHSVPELAEAAARNGASLLQVRDKRGSARDTIALTEACIAAVAGTGVPVLVNDRIDVAIASGAAGAHVGQSDVPVRIARAMMGPEAIIGLTAKLPEHIEQAPRDAVSYFGVGGIFATTTKHNRHAPIGLEGLRVMVDTARACGFSGPLAGIAGIDESNAAQVIEAGADGVCVVSAVSKASDPGAAVAGLARIVGRARGKPAA